MKVRILGYNNQPTQREGVLEETISKDPQLQNKPLRCLLQKKYLEHNWTYLERKKPKYGRNSD